MGGHVAEVGVEHLTPHIVQFGQFCQEHQEILFAGGRSYGLKYFFLAIKRFKLVGNRFGDVK